MDPHVHLPAGSSTSPMINYRKDAKKAVKFTFMVAGELGTGKTTFINCLLNRRIMAHAYEGARPADTKTLLFTLAHAVALPNASLLARNQFDAAAAADEPGIALTETSVEILDDVNVRLHLNIIDTPGFGDNLDNEMCYAEIENYLKQQFDSVLAEETRVRRNPRFVDTRVHVLLYFIAPTGHGLREMDIACMKRLARYVNVIPVLARADSFTEAELRHFKAQVNTDIERFNVPTFQFDTFLDEYDADADGDLIAECQFLARLQPFAVVASEQDFEIRDAATGATKTIKARQYPWGLVDVNNPKYSDLPVLRSVLFGSHLQDLKDLTHDFLYETYRTERLSEVTGKESGSFSSTPRSTPAAFPEMLTAVPSLLNLAQLTANDTSMQLDFTQDEPESASVASAPQKKNRSMLYDDADDTASLAPADNASFSSSRSAYLNISSQRNLDSTDKLFKRMSIAPQRSQLRQISETVPYVIRHERILERQQKLEEMEMVSAKELESRAAMLEQKAALLKAREKLLLEKLEMYKRAEASKKAASADDNDDNDDDNNNDDDDTVQTNGGTASVADTNNTEQSSAGESAAVDK
ncbi:hypothetical protein METBIDRAFT_42966 [Metschnikowia bicuspidata var. bicuspidata NRRL YB-4993]|uniref:Septin-type G domain-containing protein n=1 Tax=Metschnikowia bicuspidata var. bicuspidata NRRL YB-4993 TaxID=869754 RepID=A0A1A0H8L2_9ASCO|nr:hypothetical protein METBIDRAFT_42966 [Metschnikowia bicuspidata var. bicuspidata NRRL YB-4993]OBA20356.1 hypothetical protein METBIDRAFT_42966 [Metschnikowia bicuspidata var. bicuspidata NRRL YB-4993]